MRRSTAQLREALAADLRPPAAAGPRDHRPGQPARSERSSAARSRCLPKVKAKLTGRTQRAACSNSKQRLDLCADVRGPLEAALVDDCPLTARDGGFIRAGYRADLDELRELTAGGKQWIAEYQAGRVRADRHPEPQGRLQHGLRLLPRSHARPPRQGARRLHPQADAQERRAVHHAGAEGVRREGPRRRGEAEAARVRPVRRAPRDWSPPPRRDCKRRPTRSPRSTCSPASPNWPARATTCGRRSSPSRCSTSKTAAIRCSTSPSRRARSCRTMCSCEARGARRRRRER